MKLDVAIAFSIFSLAGAQLAIADDDRGFKRLGANLVGYEETPASISTTGKGRFDALIRNDDTEIVYQLSYSDLEGDVLQAHIHFGQRRTSGGIAVFLCTNLGNGPAGTQACPAPPATITGTIAAADVIGPEGQGISPSEFEELVRAIRAGATYANVHTSLVPTGEIRGQIRPGNSRGQGRH